MFGCVGVEDERDSDMRAQTVMDTGGGDAGVWGSSYSCPQAVLTCTLSRNVLHVIESEQKALSEKSLCMTISSSSSGKSRRSERVAASAGLRVRRSWVGVFGEGGEQDCCPPPPAFFVAAFVI